MNKTYYVMYTDGSAILNRQGKNKGGYGLHGYSYKEMDKRGMGGDVPKGHLITDEGYEVRTTVNSVTERKAIVLNYIDGIVSLNEDNGTNNRAELMAVIKTIETIVENKEPEEQLSIKIHTDSMYAISIFKRIKASISLSDLANEDLVNKFNEVYLSCKEFTDVELVKIAAHSGLHGNELVDMYASIASSREIRGEPISIIKITPVVKKEKYWTKVIFPTELVGKRIFLFGNQMSKKFYSILNFEKEESPDKLISSKSFGLIKKGLENSEILDKLEDIYFEFLGTMETISYIELGLMKNTLLKHVVSTFGYDHMYQIITTIKTSKYYGIKIGTNTIVQEQVPKGVSMEIANAMTHMSKVMKKEEELKARYVDITNYFVLDDGKMNTKLSKESEVVIKLGEGTLNLLFNVHLPSYAFIKKYEKVGVKLELVICRYRRLPRIFVKIVSQDNSLDSAWLNLTQIKPMKLKTLEKMLNNV